MESVSLKPEDDTSQLFFYLCPCCHRAVPGNTFEHYCINDGTPMLECCPVCKTRITSPYARFCANCGLAFANVTKAPQS
jgi:uncharacterized CHY-type Zn-finger protein